MLTADGSASVTPLGSGAWGEQENRDPVQGDCFVLHLLLPAMAALAGTFLPWAPSLKCFLWLEHFVILEQNNSSGRGTYQIYDLRMNF